MDAIFRTWDLSLREGRRSVLLQAAQAADAVAAGSPFDLLVVGSLARGQVHPWSDLDLILKAKDPVTKPDHLLRSRVEAATDLSDADVLLEEDIVGSMRENMLRDAVPVSLVAPLSDLPDPSEMIPRCAFAMEFLVANISRELDRGVEWRAKVEEPRVGQTILEGAVDIARDSLRERSRVSVKRLAVFHDGGRSAWLDDYDDEEALRAMLDRLARPASEPFERDAVIVPEVIETLCWGLRWDEGDNIFDRDVDLTFSRLRDATERISAWAWHLRKLELAAAAASTAP